MVKRRDLIFVVAGFVLLCASAAAGALGIGPGSWQSETSLRGVHVGLRVVETPGGPAGVFCAHRADGTTLAVPWGAGELVPVHGLVSGFVASGFSVDALGVTFLFRRSGADVSHWVIRNGVRRDGTHVLVESAAPACAFPSPPAGAAASQGLAGLWRGVLPDPEGPTVELWIAQSEQSVDGAVCFAAGNGSIVYWALPSVGASRAGRFVRWVREPVPAGLRHRTAYRLRVVEPGHARLGISDPSARRTVRLRPGHARRGCTAALSLE